MNAFILFLSRCNNNLILISNEFRQIFKGNCHIKFLSIKDFRQSDIFYLLHKYVDRYYSANKIRFRIDNYDQETESF